MHNEAYKFSPNKMIEIMEEEERELERKQKLMEPDTNVSS